MFIEWPLSFDEGILLTSFKPIFFAVFFAAQARKFRRHFQFRRRLKTTIRTLTDNEVQFREASGKMERRKMYDKRTKIMKNNPDLYNAMREIGRAHV